MSEGAKQLRYPREVDGGLCGGKNHVNLLHMFCRKLFLDVLAVVDHKISAHLMTPLTRLRTRRSADDQGVCLRFQELRSDGSYSPAPPMTSTRSTPTGRSLCSRKIASQAVSAPIGREAASTNV